MRKQTILNITFRCLITLLALNLAACTTITVDHDSRMSLFKSPETSGTGRVDIHGTLASTQNVELASATFDPIFLSGTTLSTNLTYSNGANFFLVVDLVC